MSLWPCGRREIARSGLAGTIAGTGRHSSDVASWTAYGLTFVTRVKKGYPETDETGQFWRSTMIDMDNRLRAARGIAKTETEASKVFETLKRRGHPDAPPPTISDG